MTTRTVTSQTWFSFSQDQGNFIIKDINFNVL